MLEMSAMRKAYQLALTLYTLMQMYANSPYCFLYNSQGADKENLFINQENIKSVIISFILMTLLCNAAAILLGEIRC